MMVCRILQYFFILLILCLFILPFRPMRISTAKNLNQKKKWNRYAARCYFLMCYLDHQCIVPSRELQFQMRTCLGRYETLYHLIILKGPLPFSITLLARKSIITYNTGIDKINFTNIKICTDQIFISMIITIRLYDYC